MFAQIGCGTSSRGLVVFVCTGAGVFRIEWGDVMKKLFGSFFPWMHSMNDSRAATRGLVKLWWLSMAVVLGTILLGFSAPVMGQAVNATLLGTVRDSSGAAVAGAKGTATEMKPTVNPIPTTTNIANNASPYLPPTH